MQKYVDFVWDSSGNVQSGASVQVNTSGGGAATIYSDDGVTTQTNPITTGADGSFAFYAANGLYDIVITKTGLTFDSADSSAITLYDPLDGVATGTGTLGSIYFGGTGGAITQDNTNLFWDNTNNQLQLAATGSGAGILIGGDTQLYRSAANVLRTPDSLTVDGNAIITGTTTLTGTIISNLIFTDATYDIGASGATRPRDLFLSRNAIFGGTLSITGLLTVNSGNIRLDNNQGLEWGGSTNFIIGNNTSNFVHFYTNDTQRVLIGSTGIVSIGTTATTGQLVVDQTSTTAAIPVISLEQRDVDQDWFEFDTTIGTGNATEAVGAKTLTTTHFMKVEITGVGARYFPVGTIA